MATLLRELAIHAGKVLTHRHLLAKCWEGPDEPDVQVLRVHMRNLRQKIEELPEEPSLIVTEQGDIEVELDADAVEVIGEHLRSGEHQPRRNGSRASGAEQLRGGDPELDALLHALRLDLGTQPGLQGKTGWDTKLM